MKAEGYKQLVIQSVSDAAAGDPSALNLLAKHLEMVDNAKQELRNAGYGWLGLDILETVKLVPHIGNQASINEETE